MEPFFSVVIPLYNKENYIRETLSSVLNQTFQDFEIVLINDGSTDSSLEIISSIKDNRIQVFNQKNSGLSATRNKGIKYAKAKFIAFLDADDLWKEDFLETIFTVISTFKTPKIIATKYSLLSPNKTIDLKTTPFSQSKIKTVNTYSISILSQLTQSSFAIDRDVFKDTGFFNEKVNYGEDEDFYLRCFAQYNLFFYDESKAYYRVGFENQMTSPNANFKRIIPDFSSYLTIQNRKELKPYLDFIHYKLVVLFKMERNYELVDFYKQKIELKHLNFTQKVKYILPVNWFYCIKHFYLWTSKIFTKF